MTVGINWCPRCRQQYRGACCVRCGFPKPGQTANAEPLTPAEVLRLHRARIAALDDHERRTSRTVAPQSPAWRWPLSVENDGDKWVLT